MDKTKLLAVGAIVTVVLAGSAICASAASAKRVLQLNAEGKRLKGGAEVPLVAGYSMGGCYWEEQEFKVTVNGSKADKLARTGEPGQLENCDGGAKAIEITSASRMIVKLAPLRIHISGPCVYEFKEISAPFVQREWGPEIEGTATGKLNKTESHRSSTCAKTRTTFFDMALSGVETRLIS